MEKKLSVVVSVYNEEQALPMFYETIKLILEILPWDYELLFVNDGSRDDSLSILKEYAARDEKVKVVSFSRNFGHEAAMIAGIDYAESSAWMLTCSIRRNACRRLCGNLRRVAGSSAWCGRRISPQA